MEQASQNGLDRIKGLDPKIREDPAKAIPYCQVQTGH